MSSGKKRKLNKLLSIRMASLEHDNSKDVEQQKFSFTAGENSLHKTLTSQSSNLGSLLCTQGSWKTYVHAQEWLQ